jgi:hypothetical protein
MHRTHRRRLAAAVRSVAVEALEVRRVLDATYFPLSAGDFRQDWSDTSLITTADNWDTVPSILGYRGDDLTAATGADPQTILAFGTSPIDVNANQTNPSTSTTGGVSEFEIANPTIALQGSGTADAPFILLHLNTTGLSSVNVRYLVRDIDGSTDNAIQQVALQYRIGETGDFVNVPAGYIADATDGGTATRETPIDVILPAEAANQPQLQVRIITTNAAGNDEWVGIDDIVVPGVNNPAGAINFATTSVNVNENAGPATLRVDRVGGSSGAVSATFQVNPGTATLGNDYTLPPSLTLNWAPGDTAPKFIQIPIVNDAVAEPNEAFTVTLVSTTGGATLGTTTTATVNIADDDVAVPAVLVNEVASNPAGQDNPFEYVEIKGAPGTPLTNVYFVSIEGQGGGAGTADQVIDLSSATIGASGLLVLKSPTGGFAIPAGTSVLTSSVFDTVNGGLENDSNSFVLIFSPTAINTSTDLDPENDGTLNLPAGASLIDGVGIYTNGAGPGGSGQDRVYGAGIEVRDLTPDVMTRLVGNDNPNDPNAWFAGDLQTPSPAGSATVDYEPDATSPNTPSGAYLTPGAANYQLSDQPNGRINFSIGAATVNETDGTATFTVRRLGGTAGTVSVAVSTVDGTAVAGSDFVLDTASPLVFAPGETLKTVTVSLVNDTLAEPNETFSVVLSSPAGGATIGGKTAVTVTLLSDDLGTPPAVVVNEVLANPATTIDNPAEYVELRGTPGASLVQTYFVSIEGDGGGAGIADLVVDLGFASLGSNGLLVIKGTGGFNIPAGTAVFTDTRFDASGGILENGANSFAVIFSPTPIAAGTDLDTNNDGVLDNLPAGAQLIDSVGWQSYSTTNAAFEGTVYGANLTAAPGVPNITPDAASRLVTNTTPNAVAAWFFGDILAGGSAGNLEVAYDPAAVVNAPAGAAVLTPGASNFAGVTVLKGDMNGDNVVNNQDIAPFVQALTDLAAYQAQYPGLDPIARGDIDNNGALNNQDIAPFVALLTNTAPAPAATPTPTRAAPAKAPRLVTPAVEPTITRVPVRIAGDVFASGKAIVA